MAAERLAHDLWHVACFHAQQASEKALKALLTRITGDAVPTHNAHLLLRALSDLGEAVPDSVVGAANALDRYYIPTRYPDALDFADAALVYNALDAAQAIAWRTLCLRGVLSVLLRMRSSLRAAAAACVASTGSPKRRCATFRNGILQTIEVHPTHLAALPLGLLKRRHLHRRRGDGSAVLKPTTEGCLFATKPRCVQSYSLS